MKMPCYYYRIHSSGTKYEAKHNEINRDSVGKGEKEKERYLVIICNERELLGLQELRLGNIQPIFSIEKLHHAAITVSHSQVIMNH